MDRNIDLNVRAQDHASQTLRDISERVSVLADQLAGADGLAVSSDSAAAAMNRLADTSHRIEILAMSIGAVVAAVASVKIVSRALSGPISAFIEWTDATKGLTESQLDYIQVIEGSVGVSDRVAADLLGLAGAYGIAAEQQQYVVTGAIGLAETLDQNVNSVLLKLSDLLNGNEKALDSIIPQLRNMETAEEKLAEVERLAAEGLGSKHDAMTDLEGAQHRFNASLEQMTRIIGEAVAPAVTGLLNLATALANAIGNVLHSAMGMLHRDFVTFANDLLDVNKMTEFFELSILAIEKSFIQLNQGLAALLDMAGLDMEAFLDEVDLRLADIDRRADEAIDRRIAAENAAATDEGKRTPLSIMFNPSIPDVPDFDLEGIFRKIASGDADSKDKQVSDRDTELVAMESRLLNSGSTVSSSQMTAKNTEAAAKTLLNIQQILQRRDPQQDALLLKVATA